MSGASLSDLRDNLGVLRFAVAAVAVEDDVHRHAGAGQVWNVCVAASVGTWYSYAAPAAEAGDDRLPIAVRSGAGAGAGHGLEGRRPDARYCTVGVSVADEPQCTIILSPVAPRAMIGPYVSVGPRGASGCGSEPHQGDRDSD